MLQGYDWETLNNNNFFSQSEAYFNLENEENDINDIKLSIFEDDRALLHECYVINLDFGNSMAADIENNNINFEDSGESMNDRTQLYTTNVKDEM